MKPKPYQLPQTFLPCAEVASNDIICPIWGISFDSATSERSGARMGPRHIRSASRMLIDGAHPLFDTEPARHVVDRGDIITGSSINLSLDSISAAVIEAKTEFCQTPLYFMGGDHLISLGVMRGLVERNHPPVLIHFDGHHDCWPDHFGEEIGHGTWVRNAVEEGLLSPSDVIQIGIRSPSDVESRSWLPDRGGTVFSARQASTSPQEILAKILNLTTSRQFYISLDIDALDPAYAPGTGTPEIGGLTPHFMLDMIETMMAYNAKNLIGMDVVEVNPSFDHGEITSLAAATFIWTAMAGDIRSRANAA